MNHQQAYLIINWYKKSDKNNNGTLVHCNSRAITSSNKTVANTGSTQAFQFSNCIISGASIRMCTAVNRTWWKLNIWVYANSMHSKTSRVSSNLQCFSWFQAFKFHYYSSYFFSSPWKQWFLGICALMNFRQLAHTAVLFICYCFYFIFVIYQLKLLYSIRSFSSQFVSGV